MSSDVARHLKTEELYQKLMHLVYTPDRTDDINPDDVRRILDAILSQGKIGGYLTTRPGRVPEGGETWRLKTDHSREVFVHGVSHARLVVYRDPRCFCINELHARRGHQSSSTIAMFTEIYEPVDKQIESWQRIVDSV